MEKNRVNYITFINVIAALSVVILHANGSFWTYSTDAYWGVSNVIESTLFCAVPLFFMLSGATLIDYRKRYSTKTYFKKRFVKTFIPFLFWSVFGMYWASRKIFAAMIKGEPHADLNWTFTSVIDGIFNTKFTQIYWFFVPLFCIYMVIPFFAAIAEEKRIKIFTYAIVGSLIFNYSIPFAITLLREYAGISLYSTYTIFVSHQYLIYPLIGYVLHKKELKLKFRLIIYALAIASLMLFMLGTYFETRKSGVINGTFRGYYNLPCALYSSGVFLFLKNVSLRIKSAKVNRFFTFLQGYTFPIYLIHRYLLDVFEENLHYIHVEKASIIYVVGGTAAAVILCVLITWVLRKIPFLRRIVP